jgi:orotate phosphoribosyltransferase
MTNNAVEEMFRKSGAILNGHFLLTSGLHSPVYWEKFRVLQFPNYTEQLCRMIAEHFRSEEVQLVAGPTTGGIILAFEVARQLGVRAAYAEQEPGGERAFRRGARIEPGERVLVVDDIMTRGGSIRDVISAVTKDGGQVIGVGVLVDRSDQPVDFGVPLFSCHRAIPPPTYAPQDCPLCAAQVPLVKAGGGSAESYSGDRDTTA